MTTTLKSIDDLLRDATERLDKAANEIRDLPLDPAKEHIRLIGEALVNIFQIQHQIFRLSPELQPDFLNDEKPDPDPELSEEKKSLVEKLSADEIQKIDDLLLSHASDNWRKVAMIVGLTMMNHENRKSGIPDIFYAQRVRLLVEKGLLESQGNLQYMRYSEVKIPPSNE